VDIEQNYISKAERLKKSFATPTGSSLVLGVAIATLVCFPFFHSGRLLLLDWVQGTNAPFLTTSLYGLNGGLTTSIIPAIAMAILNTCFSGAATWIPLFLFFPIGTLGIGRLVGGAQWRRFAAGVLFVVNPFVFNRIYVGQIVLLLGYALLPFAISSLLNSAVSPERQWLKVVLWWFLLTSLSPHFVWIFGLSIGIVFLYELVARRQKIIRLVKWLFSASVMFLVTISYLLIPSLFTSLPTTVGTTSLNLYRTVADPILGLVPNVLGMYGFWRIGPGPTLPKNQLPGWFLLLLLLLVAASFALSSSRTGGEPPSGSESTKVRSNRWSAARAQLQSHQLFIVIGTAGFFGLLLALGTQGPTGALFSLLYNNVSFFQIMREPQKFLILWVLCLSVFYAFGAERIVLSVKSKRLQKVAAFVLCAGLPIAYTPTMFAGLSNQIALSSVPAAYQQADKLMGPGQGQILYLPWHIYMSYPFANNRVVANIAFGVFTRGVISGDNVESGGVSTQSTSPRSAYLESLYLKGSMINDFGLLVAPLGVQYVVLTKSADWASYAWLNKQLDLKLVTDNSSLMVWENTAFIGANTSDTSKGLYSNGHRVFERSPVSYKISKGKPGIVTTDIPYQKGWTFNGTQVNASPQGLVQVPVGKSGGTLSFDPWKAVIVGYLLSGIMVFTLGAIVFAGNRKGKSKGRRSKIT
jgi:hypothetical protein